ncbi:MAG: GDCCVxC domain-containing (seleno)protein [Nitrospirae bacterium]|nr:GDCCVxC domain-containing (seleno)protein [Nitrospirota bacterium]
MNTSNQKLMRESTLICPQCGTHRKEMMPVDACHIIFQCTYCGVSHKPLPGDCCVFCSYGTVPCPPIQQSRG